ncbi:MAG: amidohydrolase [Bacteroidales bacterium]|nr:amidohydrolase [Bacteroidales bacterium]MCB9013197.1 amidohydrolase [Bacteroidales bacterium]
MDNLQNIKKLATGYYDEIISIRRHIHAHPELSFEEYETSAFICKILDKWGISYKKGVAGTGIVASIEGKGPGRTIAFRADMDALPIQESNDIPYKSLNDGKMHACGHDVHTSSLLGAAKILNELKSEWKGKIKFIFQPGEEKIPGGASLMIKEDALLPDEPEIIIAQHVFPDMESGNVGFRSGQYMASSDEIYITVHGKGGHAALPDRLIDPVLISAHLITSLQQIVSRHAKPGMPTVLSFGKIEAAGAVNVIPQKVKIEGTFRTMNEEWRKKAHELIRSISENLVNGMGGKLELEIRHGYPVLVNNPDVTEKARSIAIDYLGQESVHELDYRMTAEDFAYFAQKYPATLFRLGTSEKGKESSALHTSAFNVNEESIELSMGLLAYMGIRFLE